MESSLEQNSLPGHVKISGLPPRREIQFDVSVGTPSPGSAGQRKRNSVERPNHSRDSLPALKHSYCNKYPAANISGIAKTPRHSRLDAGTSNKPSTQVTGQKVESLVRQALTSDTQN
ncbi:hypothetical protein CSKR_201318 [Clonorchis sinensis]|uniref:Uncharacterized protein n=1 Tax=Clonorchis sinensis TaxID=79923 RepID=A0A8T1MP72_CLOSI|nr:hypothetical protein CSKR_201318 [Clonorchis sinensis]